MHRFMPKWYFPAAALLVVSLIAVGLFLWQLLSGVGLLSREQNENLAWTTIQSEVEYGRVMTELERARSGQIELTGERLRLKTDIMVGRLQLMAGGSYPERLSDIASYQQLIELSKSVVPEIDAALADIDTIGVPATAGHIADILTPLAPVMHTLAVDTYLRGAGRVSAYQENVGRILVFGLILFAFLSLAIIAFAIAVAVQTARLKKSSIELTDLAIELRAASEAKSKFLANMSHELRTPLNAIMGFSELISHQYMGKVPERYREYASDINDSARHLLNLITDILDLSRIEAGRFEMEEDIIDLGDVVDRSVTLLRDMAGKRGLAITTILADTPPLYADERLVMQILVNLMNNSIKFTPRGGTITISTTIMASGDIETIVEDTGRGIPPRDLATILDPYKQASNAHKTGEQGTGLGLSIVRSLVEMHGGELAMTSEVDKGTRVYFTLPADRIRPDSVESNSEASSARTSNVS